MHISSNKILPQNQLVMGRVTQKLIYMLKFLNFIHAKKTLLSYSNTPLTSGKSNGDSGKSRLSNAL